MLGWIHVRNIAVIDDLQVEFEPGLNLLTGETRSRQDNFDRPL